MKFVPKNNNCHFVINLIQLRKLSSQITDIASISSKIICWIFRGNHLVSHSVNNEASVGVRSSCQYCIFICLSFGSCLQFSRDLNSLFLSFCFIYCSQTCIIVCYNFLAFAGRSSAAHAYTCSIFK